LESGDLSGAAVAGAAARVRGYLLREPAASGDSVRPAARSRIEAQVLRLQGLLKARQFSAVLEGAQALLGEVPENRDVLYLLAVSQRYLQQLPAALATLARLEKLYPEFSRVHQERGHCLLAARNPSAALEAFLVAVNLNAALPGSWQALEVLYGSAGKPDEARMAAAHVAKLKSLPGPVVTAKSLLADGEIYEAERVVREFLHRHGDHIEGMRLLALIGAELGIVDDADFLLESVLVFAPDYHLARYDYVRVLLQRHRHSKALEECRKLLAIDPRNRDYRTVLATTYVAIGQHEQALQIYRELLAETPQAPDLHLSVAHVLKTEGRHEEAVQSYWSAAQARPSFGDAYWSLANLKTYRFSDEQMQLMRQQEAAKGAKRVDRYHLCFALGKALEDRGQYEESFRYYARGNELKGSEIRYRPETIERSAQLQASMFTPEFLATRQTWGSPRADVIFIVGLPRSGSTLLEQILASHSQVEGTMELADIPRLVHRLQGRDADELAPRYPRVLSELTAEQCRNFGNKYLADTQIYRTDRPFFIDKMPNNFRHLGLIHLMLPNARIIDARREAMACCFSNFKQLFAAGQEFTYSLQDIGRYYRSYVQLMAHWDAVLPGKILRVQYEEVVQDLEGNVRRILEFCGLPFEPQCLDFHRTERSVRTASSEQVRRPIFKEGLDQWRHFDAWLGPLRAVLGELASEQ
jgi:tetratricopeptide (TPR) repeat protein